MLRFVQAQKHMKQNWLHNSNGLWKMHTECLCLHSKDAYRMQRFCVVRTSHCIKNTTKVGFRSFTLRTLECCSKTCFFKLFWTTLKPLIPHKCAQLKNKSTTNCHTFLALWSPFECTNNFETLWSTLSHSFALFRTVNAQAISFALNLLIVFTFQNS